MQKLRGNWWAKAAAMLLCICSLLTAIASLAAMIYDGTVVSEEDFLEKQIYRKIAYNYSAAALACYWDGQDKEQYRADVEQQVDPRLVLAVVKAAEMDIRDGDIQLLAESLGAYDADAEYLYGTAETVRQAQYCFRGGEDYDYLYALNSIPAMLGNGYSYNRGQPSTAAREEVQFVFYDRATGLFYYETESGFYPVHSVAVALEEGRSAKTYTLTSKQDGTEAAGQEGEPVETPVVSGDGNVGTEPDAADGTDYDAAEEWEYVDVFGNGLPDMRTWQYVQMENTSCAVRLLTDDEYEVLEGPGEYVYCVEDVSAIWGSGYVHGYENTYISNSYLVHGDAVGKHSCYYVFSYVGERVEDSGFPDYFEEARIWNGRWNVFRSYALLLETVSVFVFFATLLFLLYAAGWHGSGAAVRLVFADRVWFEVVTLAVVVMDVAIAALMAVVCDGGIFNIANMLLVETELAAAFSAIVIWYLMTAAARIKAGAFWRHTFVYICWKYFVKICKWLWKYPLRFFRWMKARHQARVRFYKAHVPLVVRCVGVLIAVSFVLVLLCTVCWIEGYYMPLLVLLLIALWVVTLPAMMQMVRIAEGGRRIAEGNLSEPIDTKGLVWVFKEHAENINKVGDGIANAVETQMKSERFKTELITNVSHDIKTPLTSIINYVDFIKKEDLGDGKLAEYVEVLDRQSARLKKLIEDLMEASKASTGNLTVDFEVCDARVLLTQLVGEFEEKMKAGELELIVNSAEEPVNVRVDCRHIWRVFDNLFGNICKYAQPGTRVYINLERTGGEAAITFKNISRYQLNISSEELMERFVRGDSSRNTEGSGLGLSIAQSLTSLMDGAMELDVDGDLFKVILRFPLVS